MLNTLMIKTHQLPIKHQLDKLTNLLLVSLLVNSIDINNLVTNNKLQYTHNNTKEAHNIIHNNIMEDINKLFLYQIHKLLYWLNH
jgi:hypothetical protein